jgi:hypothetical protein
MTFTGTLSAINNALAGLTLTPAANYFGAAVLDLQLSDQGNSGAGVCNSRPSRDPGDRCRRRRADLDRHRRSDGAEDTLVGPLVFALGDVDTPLGALTVTATSNDGLRLPNAVLSLSGTGASRTLTSIRRWTPMAGR